MVELNLEQLKSAVSGGSKKAADSLFQMAGLKVTVSASNFLLVSLQEVVSKIELNKEDLIAYSSIKGELTGESFLVITECGALKLANVLSGETLGEGRILSEIDRSAIKEVLNIIANAYLLEIVETIKIENTSLTPPGFARVEYLQNSLRQKIDGRQGDAVILETSLEIAETNINLSLYFVFYGD